MNLRNFLLEVDRITGQMSKAELEAFIHETGRLLPENKRSDYLDRLEVFLSELPDGGTNGNSGMQKVSKQFEEECVKLQEELSEIEEGVLCIAAEVNYKYDDWYDNDEEEFIFTDPNGVADVVETVCEFVHKCVECEEYVYGYKIAKQLARLRIYVENDEWDSFYDGVSIAELELREFCSIDYKQLIIDGAYLAYCVNDMEERADAIYKMIENSQLSDISLEMVMQNGEELTDIVDFLPIWIEYLGKLTTWNAQKLLKEALELTGDAEVLLSNARQFTDLHPGLYEQYLDFIWNTEENKKIFDIGNEALEKIDVKYIVRSRIAKRLSTLALEEQRSGGVEKYWLEAFRSETNVTNYMRVFVESGDSRVFLEEIRRIYHRMYKKAGSSSRIYAPDGELKMNNPGTETVYMLAFLGGEFQYVREHAMNVTAALGWSSTFMKCGLAAFLLLLLEADKLQTAGREMCGRIVSAVNFDKEEYQRYSNRQNDLSSAEWFWECLKKWKESIVINDAQKQEYLQWIEQLIKKRVVGIMEANRRNYYGECASYIAAYGEVVESRGECAAKQRVLLEYKAMYPRRSAFHGELRKYGMYDTRRRR